MCGINGILRLDPDAPPVDRGQLLAMRDAMQRRGPDDHGEWIDAEGGVGFGHRRLAIIDLSPGGHQPKSRNNGRFHLTFNGEIYNYRELRAELERAGDRFETQSDTEVVLALFAREGVAMLPRLRGMYAFAIWDALQNELTLCRDPYGIKPLYYGEQNGTLRFASQVKALTGEASITDPDPAGLVGFLLWGSVPEPFTMYRHIRAVPSGHYVQVRQGRVQSPVAHYRFEEPLNGAVGDVAAALEQSVQAHLIADVPVAVFLSAGIDSSMIAAVANRLTDAPVKTVTLRFDDYADTPMDEAPLAAYIARALGTEHVERRVQRDDFVDLWPRALEAMDQPSIDGFNTYVVSQAAHEEGCKVVLSGLGGDELLGGYPSFRDVPQWQRWVSRLRKVPGLPAVWPWLSRRLRPGQPKLGGMLDYGMSLHGSYFLRKSLFLPFELGQFLDPQTIEAGLRAYDPLADARKYLSENGAREPEEIGWRAVHLMESTQFMRNQLLRDSDWASMAHSLELRVPLVDAALRAAIGAARYEPARSGGKAALAQLVAPELPDAVWNRPKSGFSIPVMQWLSEEVDLGTSQGQASRKLAMRVLEGFGLQLQTDRAAIT